MWRSSALTIRPASARPGCVNESERVDCNVRFHWIPVIGDDIFVVWTSGYTTYPLAPFRFPNTRALSRPLNGALVIKAVHRLTP